MNRILAVIAGAVRPDRTDDVHFHTGPRGHAYVCENPDCTSPGLHVSHP
jgi:hypothetical protein